MNYKKLFFSDRNYMILVIVQFVSYFGAWFSQVGVYTMLLEFDFKPFFSNADTIKNYAITFSTVFAFLPPIVLAPLSGVIIDSIKPKTLLITSVALELLSVFGLLFIKDASFIYVLFVLIFLRLSVASLYFQTQMSLLPTIFNAAKLKLANELFSVVWAVSYTAGMACAGIYIAKFGIKAAFILDSCFFVFALLLLSRLSLSNEPKPNRFNQAFSLAKDALKYLFANKKILHLIILHGLVGFTAYDALINFLAHFTYKDKVSFGGGVLAISMIIGLSNSIRACSLVIGPLALSRFVNEKSIVFLYLAQGIGILLWGFLQFNFYLSFIGLIAAGFFTSTIWSFTYTAIQRACDKAYYGRIIAYVDAFYMSCSLAITLITGALFDAGFSSLLVSSTMAIVFIFGAIYYSYFNRRYV